MKTEAINDLIKMVRNTHYFGLELKVLQTDVLKVTITGAVIIPHPLIEDITAICKKHNLLYYFRVSLEDNKPEIMIFEEDETF